VRVGAGQCDREFPARTGIELGEHVAQVPLDGARADEQLGADLGVRPPRRSRAARPAFRASAVRAVEVAVLEDGDRRVERATDVVAARINVVRVRLFRPAPQRRARSAAGMRAGARCRGIAAPQAGAPMLHPPCRTHA